MDDKKIKITTKKYPTFSIILFIVVLVVSIGLFAGNRYLEKDISKIYSEVQTYKDDIILLKKEKRIQVYSLLESNKNILKKMEKTSKITDYIKELSKISIKTGIDFKGFYMANGKLKTSAVSRNKMNNVLAYKKVRDFIKFYRSETGEDKSLFDLEFINSFDGMDTIKFNTVFNVK